MKHLVIGLAVMLVMIVSFMVGFKLLARHIYQRTDCERFNIDNIELRTGINIPKIVDYDCSCGDGFKNSSFVLDPEYTAVEDYALKHEFKLHEGMYLAEGDNENTRWKASLDPESNRLEVHIEYKDTQD